MFKKLLVPVDGSLGSFNALDVAIDMANAIKADVAILTVVHVMPAPSWHVDPEMKSPTDSVELSSKMGDQIISMAKIKAEKIEGKAEFHNLKGYPSDTIVEQAKALGCDCIVIGSRGLSGIEKLFLGSVSSQVAQTAEVPVLLVK